MRVNFDSYTELGKAQCWGYHTVMKSSLRSASLLLVGLIASSAVAIWWPVQWSNDYNGWYAANPWLQPLWEQRLFALVSVTMFAVGTLLSDDEVRGVVRRWPTVLGGTALQYISMPLLAWIIARGWGLSGPALTGVLLVGCVPGAMASNVLTLAARGNTSYSVSLTTLATLLSPLMVPLVMQLALGQSVEVAGQLDALRTSRTLVLTVVLPVVLGFTIRRFSCRVSQWCERWSSTVANVAILLIIAMVVANNRDRLQQLSLPLLPPLLILNLAGYLTGYGGGWALRFDEPKRRALTLEVGMQNAGLGAALAANMFSPEASVAPAIYTFGCMFTGTLLAWGWAWRPPKGS